MILIDKGRNQLGLKGVLSVSILWRRCQGQGRSVQWAPRAGFPVTGSTLVLPSTGQVSRRLNLEGQQWTFPFSSLVARNESQPTQPNAASPPTDSILLQPPCLNRLNCFSHSAEKPRRIGQFNSTGSDCSRWRCSSRQLPDPARKSDLFPRLEPRCSAPSSLSFVSWHRIPRRIRQFTRIGPAALQLSNNLERHEVSFCNCLACA